VSLPDKHLRVLDALRTFGKAGLGVLGPWTGMPRVELERVLGDLLERGFVKRVGDEFSLTLKGYAELNPSLARERALAILRKHEAAKSFRFYIDATTPTPYSAASLEELLTVVKIVDPRSVQYHLSNKHLSRWIREVIGDEDLADWVTDVEGKSPSLSPEESRKLLLDVLTVRVNDLREIASKTVVR